MVGLTSSVMLVLALPSLVAHLTTIALTKALQSYSRSRLEEYCADHGKPERAAEVAHLDEATERAGRGHRGRLRTVAGGLDRSGPGPLALAAAAGAPRALGAL